MSSYVIVNTKLVDRGMKAAMKSIAGAARKVCKVGYPTPSLPHPSGKTVAQIAIANEVGSAQDNRPPRPFMKQTFERYSADARKMMDKAYEIVLKGGDPAAALKVVGVWYEMCIKKTIQSGSYAPLAPYTVAKKGNSVPLIETRTMMERVSSKVVDK